MASAKEDLYAVLGVDSKASAEEIHRAHKRLMFVYHPDKRKKAPAQADAKGDVKGDGADAAALAAAADADADLKFAAISNAYHVLSDPVSRATYDLHSGRAINTPAERRRINRLKRAEAESAVALMEESVDALRAKQQLKNGLVIVEARYGDVSGVPDAEVLTDTTGAAAAGAGAGAGGAEADVGSAEGIAVAGRCVDVTVPLQMLVDDEHSSLVIHAGGSKAALSGFYDPMDSDPRVEPRRLWVRYLYLNELHEATVDDRQPLVLPLREHNAGAAGPASASVVAAAAAGSGVPANRTMRARIAQAHALADVKRRRRWVAAGVLGLLFGTAWLYATDRLPALPAWLTPWSTAASDAAKKPSNSSAAVAAAPASAAK